MCLVTGRQQWVKNYFHIVIMVLYVKQSSLMDFIQYEKLGGLVLKYRTMDEVQKISNLEMAYCLRSTTPFGDLARTSIINLIWLHSLCPLNNRYRFYKRQTNITSFHNVLNFSEEMHTVMILINCTLGILLQSYLLQSASY